jgi:hypothetical protein
VERRIYAAERGARRNLSCTRDDSRVWNLSGIGD